jgi:[ribosomal protein S5]-alanine N-acetyltransferase
MTAPVSLATPRLILRTVTMDDLASVASSWKLDEGPISSVEAEEKITRMLADVSRNRRGKLHHLCLAIIPRESPEFIGWCGLDHTDPGWNDPVLFYLLKSAWWGQGRATEAASALLQYAFLELELPRIDSGCAGDNLASRRIMEKIGMRYLGLDDDGGHSFTLSRDEYIRIENRRLSGSRT